ncbi:hypothetical protein GF407_04810 [candidate division KSB1 bacterium]|nr:hypothetical protein [candidate division KSB1 bacterium]
MNELIAAADDVQTFCLTRSWHFAFIGGLAVLRWGEPRLTRDIDLTIFSGFGGEDQYIDAILDHFKARRQSMKAFARQYRVILIETGNHIPVDIVLGGIPFEKNMINNSSFYEFEKGVSIKTCSAEDLIVMKAFADRNRDWVDVEGILSKQHFSLDWIHIYQQLEPLCKLKEAPHILTKLRALSQTTSGS